MPNGAPVAEPRRLDFEAHMREGRHAFLRALHPGEIRELRAIDLTTRAVEGRRSFAADDLAAVDEFARVWDAKGRSVYVGVAPRSNPNGGTLADCSRLHA